MASCSELDSVNSCLGHESLCPAPDQTTTTVKLIKVHAVTLSSPSTTLSFTEKASQSSHVSRVIDSDQQSQNGAEASRMLHSVHISSRLMEDFLELAKDNTEKDLETCGVLGAFLERGTFYVTTLIIPKQESNSNSCQAINEEEIFSIQNERSLFPLGWIHVMVPEAFAIVVAPKDNSRSYGIYRVCDPSGMNVLKECQEEGFQFHSHKETENGSPIYEHCTHVYKNSNLSNALPMLQRDWEIMISPLPPTVLKFFCRGHQFSLHLHTYGNEIRDIYLKPSESSRDMALLCCQYGPKPQLYYCFAHMLFLDDHPLL